MRSREHRGRRERGAALVEFAIVLPLFLLLIGGMVDFGRAFYTEVMLTNAAREGARAAMYGTSPTSRATTALSGGVRTPTVSGTPCAAGSTIGTTTVTVSAPFTWILLGPASKFFGAGGSLPTNLSGKATMQCGG